jgi:hypothetical protein
METIDEASAWDSPKRFSERIFIHMVTAIMQGAYARDLPIGGRKLCVLMWL